MNTQDELRTQVEQLLANKGDKEPLGESDSLVLSGRLDSIDVLQIVVFLEERFHIDFGEQPFDQEDFDSIARIAALIGHRSHTAGALQA